MTNRHSAAIMVALALAVASSACSDDTGDEAERLVGNWRTGLEFIVVSFDSDGSWSGTERGEQEPFDTGTYSFDGSMLTLDTAEGSEGCASGQTGTYEVTFFDDDTIELESVSDDCGARQSDFTSGMIRLDG